MLLRLKSFFEGSTITGACVGSTALVLTKPSEWIYTPISAILSTIVGGGMFGFCMKILIAPTWYNRASVGIIGVSLGSTVGRYYELITDVGTKPLISINISSSLNTKEISNEV